jgi:hypothetical protein
VPEIITNQNISEGSNPLTEAVYNYVDKVDTT